MNRLCFFLKQHTAKILLFCIMTYILFYTRFRFASIDSLISGFHQSYNERKFLAIYVTLYLLSILPVLNSIYDTNKLIRSVNVLRHLQTIWKEICITAGMFAFLSTVGWYVVVGSKMVGCFQKENVLFVLIIFFTQIIAWSEIGILATFVYSIVKNSAITYVLCQLILIMLNLSLYIIDNERYVQYSRIYLLMYDIQQLNNLQRVISVVFFHIAVIFLFVFCTFSVLSRSDLALGGNKSYAEKKG